MEMEKNVQILLASRPDGYPKESDFQVIESEIPKPLEGEVLIKVLWLSLDPYMRGRMRDEESYATPVAIGDVIVGGAVGVVVNSRTPALKPGDYVEGNLGWQSYAVSDPRFLRVVDPSIAPVNTALGVLGMPSMTAYFGLLDVGKPSPGETVVVSAASGAVGQIVGQIAKIMGCRVVGIVGSENKKSYIIDDLGFDYAINYKTSNMYEELQIACPDGIDVYFDNVGGTITDFVLEQINVGARISVCGQISQYNLQKPELAKRNMWILIRKQAVMQGFLVFQFANRHEEARKRIANWIDEGKIKYKEDVVDSLENAPKAFIGMFYGENFGKLLVRVSE